MYKLLSKEIFALLIISLGILFSVKAIFHEGFFRTIDDITPVRIEYFSKEIKAKNWNNIPIRMSSELGYEHGYPLYLFYSPLSYYVGGLLMVVGNLSHIVATKALYAIPFILGPLLFYIAVRLRLPIIGSVIATLAYSLFPFRGWDIYVRGGVAEMWAMMMIPLMLIGLSLIDKHNKYGQLVLGIGLALTLLSHNISGMMVSGLLILYTAIKHSQLRQIMVGVLLGLGLSSFFWIPSLYFLDIVKVGYSSQNSGFVLSTLYPISELLTYFKEYETTRPFTAHVMIPIVFGLLIYFATKKYILRSRPLLWWMLISLGLYIMMSSLAKPIWQLTLPLSRLVQFAWRVMVILSVTIPITYGQIYSSLNKVWLKILYVILLCVIFSQYLIAFAPKEYSYYYNYRADETGLCAVSWGEEYLPTWVEKCVGSFAESPLEFNRERGEIQQVAESNLLIEAKLKLQETATIQVNKYYFPGWNVYDNGELVPVHYSSDKFGRFTIELQPGEHDLRVIYEKPDIYIISDYITLISIIWIVFLAMKNTLSLKRANK